ncbi:MAG: tyrosine-type recombinase/integrase, partial [Phycisphaerae bacterium]|nr:tyrosine-type recombinase/integrase [candidate division KSB1 bacterium]NIV00046.1 tyrosine-type recombinase/integrase [Phycisphaerae bacterium]NIS23049.1 tyrosine-type recombinase/integrase [candidate division KSB1 bacterium]NIT69902.1 tyrosine-type recombinase/integrase [candidate division KSB1 bacterium]NIU23567.1 tyrosine-type recombinase/integrase [candidate division KSB1 bacterium]
MKPLEENLKTIKYLTQDEVARLFAKIKDKRDRALFSTIYKYGLRASEVALLKIEDVDLDRRRIRIYRLKGGVSGEYGIFSDTARLLKAYLKEREQDFHSELFLSRKKNAISRKTIDDLFRNYARKAKLLADKWHVHTLRHSIAVHMLDAGHTQAEVKDQLG